MQSMFNNSNGSTSLTADIYFATKLYNTCDLQLLRETSEINLVKIRISFLFAEVNNQNCLRKLNATLNFSNKKKHTQTVVTFSWDVVRKLSHISLNLAHECHFWTKSQQRVKLIELHWFTVNNVIIIIFVVDFFYSVTQNKFWTNIINGRRKKLPETAAVVKKYKK